MFTFYLGILVWHSVQLLYPVSCASLFSPVLPARQRACMRLLGEAFYLIRVSYLYLPVLSSLAAGIITHARACFGDYSISNSCSLNQSLNIHISRYTVNLLAQRLDGVMTADASLFPIEVMSSSDPTDRISATHHQTTQNSMYLL